MPPARSPTPGGADAEMHVEAACSSHMRLPVVDHSLRPLRASLCKTVSSEAPAERLPGGTALAPTPPPVPSLMAAGPVPALQMRKRGWEPHGWRESARCHARLVRLHLVASFRQQEATLS